jgi:xanthosine utilization system XapX-like protein
LLLAAVAAYLVGIIYFTPELRDPGTPILLTGMVLIGGVVLLTVIVLRALLRQATVLRSDMEEVI